MTSIIKNHIIKHLSAFARNLKPEQISVEVLRGKGQLRDLELNEEVLEERLELPPWLKIVKAHCSSVSVKIPWTKLKSAPVQLFIEEIRVTIRLVASAIPSTKKTGLAIGKPYDLAERVIEGISLNVQSIEIYFETDSQSKIKFGGSIMFSQFVLESRSPNWQEEHNINMTRIHDKAIHQLLYFKHINWRVLKIEASANSVSDEYYGQRSSLNSPLRFLTENGRVRITIKKNTSDCSLIAGRIELILEEIHWLAYMAHLRSAIDFYKHILDLANSVDDQIPFSLVKQQQAFADYPRSTTLPKINSSPTKLHAGVYAPVSALNAFRQFDIPQSSHHLIITRIDLHLCDDSSSDDLPSDWNIDCGAMQAIVQKLRVDFYPQHKIFEHSGEFSPRSSWLRYSFPNPFTDLAKLKLDQHFRLLTSKMEPNQRDRFIRTWLQLISQNVIIRIENLIIQSVSERTTKKEALRCMLSMNKRSKEKMPQSMSFFHLEVTSYKFPATDAYSVPPDSIHLVLAPLELAPDPKSVRWLVYALENILNSLDTREISTNPSSKPTQIPEIRIELVMPKIVLLPDDLPLQLSPSSASSSTTDPQKQSPQQSAIDCRLPRRFLIHASTAFLSNFVLLNDPFVPKPIMFENSERDSLMEFIKWAERNYTDPGILSEMERRSSSLANGLESILNSTRRPFNEWFISIPTVWVNCDFGPDTWELPLLSDLSIFGCIVTPDDDPKQNQERQGNTILLEPKTNVGVAVDHFQFVQLIQLVDRVSMLMDQVSSDRQFFHKHLPNLPNDLPLTLYCKCEKIHLRLILPPGPTPSPYDMKWTRKEEDTISPSNSTNSYPDLPNDESVNTKNVPIPDSAKGSSSALVDHHQFGGSLTPSASMNAETIGGLAVQGGLKTIESLGGVSDISVTGKLLMDVQVSRKQLVTAINLPDFANGPTPSDLESNLDTLSITTSTSAEHLFFDSTIGGDMFDDEAEDVIEAEEVLESNEQDIRLLRRKEKLLGREVNVFDVLLENLSVHARADGGRTTALGFAESIHVGERLRLCCGSVYAEKGATFSVPISLGELKMEEFESKRAPVRNPQEEAKLKLELHSANRQSLIKLGINGISISLSDEVVSQLSPFIQNSIEDENPAALDLSLERCKIEIKDPKKRYPLRITLGELTVQDGPGNESLLVKK